MHTPPLPASARTRIAALGALGLLAASAIGCGHKATPTPDKEPPAPSASPSAAAAASSAGAAVQAPARMIPTLTATKFAPAKSHPRAVFAVEGATVVVEDNRVGRIVDDTIEWVGQVPKSNPALGDNSISAVHGLWPDGLSAVFVSGNGRAPQPTYWTLTGKKGASYTVAEGGGYGLIMGVARVGETTILVADSMSKGLEIVTVRGPRLFRKPLTPAQAGCKEGEVVAREFLPPPPGLDPAVVESSPEGTLVSLGKLCQKRGPAAEVWDKAGKSRIIDLSRWWKKLSYFPRLLKGSGDELWAYTDPFSPVLHYRNGEFEQVPDLGRPLENVFVSPGGQLHGSDGRTVYRHADGKWTPVAQFAAPAGVRSLVMDDKNNLWASDGEVHRLRAGAEVPAPEGCTTPFVYLYEISSDNGTNYTYPTTRKALASFPEVSALGLVEFGDGGAKRLGITTSSQAQAEAVIAHVKATMKDEDPRYFCYVPRGPRKIDMGAK